MNSGIDHSNVAETDIANGERGPIRPSCGGKFETPLRAELYEFRNLEAMARLESEWRQIASAAGTYSQCLTYEYCTVAAEDVFSSGGSIAVAVVYDGGDPAALWPVAIRRSVFLTFARALTCGSNEEYGGPMFAGKATAELIVESLQALRKVDADILDIPWVQDGTALQAAIEAVPQSWLVRMLPRKISGHPGYGGNPGFTIDLSSYPRWEDYVSALPGGHRRNHRRRLRQLQQIGRTEIGWCHTPTQCDEVLDWLVTCKRRWAAARGINTDYLADDRLRNFFSRLARKVDLETMLVVAFIKLDDVPVAASINLQGSHELEYFVATYDERFARYGVGIALMVSMIELAHGRGLVFDMRYSHEPYKEIWSNRKSHHRVHRVYLTQSNARIGLMILTFTIRRAVFLVRRELSKLIRHLGTRKPAVAPP